MVLHNKISEDYIRVSNILHEAFDHHLIEEKEFYEALEALQRLDRGAYAIVAGR